MATALMTASYAPDFARCRILCESIDRHVTGDWHHYLLVDSGDVSLFSSLAGPRRTVIDQRALLPWWLRAVPDPRKPRRKLWLSPFGKPLRGWHIQQMMKLEFSRQAREEAIIAIDSDVILIRDYDPAALWRGNRVRLYRQPNEIDATIRSDHVNWLAHTDRLLSIGPFRLPAAGHIDSMVSWRSDTVRALLSRIEAVNGCSWPRALTRARAFSEYMLYGRFAEEVLSGEGHWPTDRSFCHVIWFADQLTDGLDGLRRFVRAIGDDQIAVGIQSFIDCPIEDVLRVVHEEAPTLRRAV